MLFPTSLISPTFSHDPSWFYLWIRLIFSGEGHSTERENLAFGISFSTCEVHKMGVLRHVAVFLSLIAFIVAFALVISAFATDYWINTDHVERNGTISQLSFVHSGLFYGARQFDYGQEIKLEPFSVYDEIQKDVSFMNRVLWIFIVFFIALGILWTFVGLLISLMNSVKLNTETVMGPSGIYIWSILAMVSYAAALGIFLDIFFTTAVNSVLLPTHLAMGFSTKNLAWLFLLVVNNCDWSPIYSVCFDMPYKSTKES